jgi:ribosomal protein L22
VALQLRFSRKRHAASLLKALQRGITQAEQQLQLDPAKLYLGTATASRPPSSTEALM